MRSSAWSLTSFRLVSGSVIFQPPVFSKCTPTTCALSDCFLASILVWSSTQHINYLHLQPYPYCEPKECRTSITHGWDGEYFRENCCALSYLCIHILQWKDSPQPLFTGSCLCHWPDDCFTSSHLPHRVMVIWIQRRKQSTSIVGYPLDT